MGLRQAIPIYKVEEDKKRQRKKKYYVFGKPVTVQKCCFSRKDSKITACLYKMFAANGNI